MVLSGKKKEMLFILGEFLRETNRRFSSSPLKVSVSKAEFIDSIKGMQVVAKQKRAVYRNLESLQNEKSVLYDKDKNLSLSRKGYKEYERIFKEFEALLKISGSIDAAKIRFKRKQQTRLR
jgi:hypothetical protein